MAFPREGFLCQRYDTCDRPKSVPLYGDKGALLATVEITERGSEVEGVCENSATQEGNGVNLTMGQLPANPDKCSSEDLWLSYAKWIVTTRRNKLQPLAKANRMGFVKSGLTMHTVTGHHSNSEWWTQVFRDWRKLDELQYFLGDNPLVPEMTSIHIQTAEMATAMASAQASAQEMASARDE